MLCWKRSKESHTESRTFVLDSTNDLQRKTHICNYSQRIHHTSLRRIFCSVLHCYQGVRMPFHRTGCLNLRVFVCFPECVDLCWLAITNRVFFIDASGVEEWELWQPWGRRWWTSSWVCRFFYLKSCYTVPFLTSLLLCICQDFLLKSLIQLCCT